MISYKGVWVQLAKHGLKKMDLLEIAKISRATLAGMGKGKPIHLGAVERMCKHFDCRIEDLIEYVPDDEEAEH